MTLPKKLRLLNTMKQEILLIDDDHVINIINTRLIKKIAPEATTVPFHNGEPAFEYIKANMETHFLIFLDINMPIMNGWEFLDEIRTIKTSFKGTIHMLTSSIDNSDKVKASTCDLVQSFISKPLKIELLETIINSFITAKV